MQLVIKSIVQKHVTTYIHATTYSDKTYIHASADDMLAYSEPFQTSKMTRFAKIING